MENYAREIDVAVSAVQTAAKLCQTVQRQITPDALEKKDRSPVTVADFGSQAIVCRALADAFPQDPVVGEEDSAELRAAGNESFLERVVCELSALGIDGGESTVCDWIDHGCGSTGERFWTLDPIDGTRGFLRGEQYAISVALIEDGQIVAAVLGCPNLPVEAGDAESP